MMRVISLPSQPPLLKKLFLFFNLFLLSSYDSDSISIRHFLGFACPFRFLHTFLHPQNDPPVFSARKHESTDLGHSALWTGRPAARPLLAAAWWECFSSGGSQAGRLARVELGPGRLAARVGRWTSNALFARRLMGRLRTRRGPRGGKDTEQTPDFAKKSPVM